MAHDGYWSNALVHQQLLEDLRELLRKNRGRRPLAGARTPAAATV
ncbi:hypothetical protein [Microbulbifer taiwanensis]